MSTSLRARRHGLRAAFAFVAITVAAVADDLSPGFIVPVKDEYGLARSNELVAMSIPLAANLNITAPQQLVLIDDQDDQVPVQWQVLMRWGDGPQAIARPIRYLLAHFRVSLGAGQSRNYVVRRRTQSHGPPVAPADPIAIVEYASTYVVHTGKATFVVGKTVADLLRMVLVDVDGDGVPESNPMETVVPPAGSLGPMLVDRFGGIYAGAFDPAMQCVLEESGPLRAVFRIEGKHVQVTPNGIGRDFLRFTTRLTFEAGAAHVRVAHTLSNDYLTNPLGDIGFARYLAHVRFQPLAPLKVRFGGEEGGAALGQIALNGPNEASLVQDSSGGPSWNQPGTTFSGFRVDAGPFVGISPESYRPQPPFASGSRSDGWMDVHDGMRGMLVAMRYPWQNYPFGLRVLGDGHVLFDFLPAEYAGLHWLDDGQRKTREFILSFHGATFDPATEARKLTHPLRPVVPFWFLKNSMAWGDTGHLRDPQLTFAQMKASGDSALTKKYETFDGEGGFGWDNFGEPVWAKNTHSTGSPRNKLSYFDKFMVSGAESWFVLSEVFAQHSMDLRTYHIAGFKRDEHPNTVLSEGMPAWPGTDMLGRNALDPALDPHRAGIPEKGKGWNGYDSEHLVVDDLYEYYLLTGSPAALDSMRQIGEGILTWPSMSPTKAIISSRIAGWTLRALVKIWLVTGDQRMIGKAADLVTSLDTFRGQTPSNVTGLTYHWLAANKYGGSAHNMDSEYDLPWQIAVGVYGLALYARETGSVKALGIIADVSNYILDFGLQDNGVFKEAIAIEDHQDFNPKPKNDGVNAWISSALALAYQVTGKPAALAYANKVFDENNTTFAQDAWHWWHVTGATLNK